MASAAATAARTALRHGSRMALRPMCRCRSGGVLFPTSLPTLARRQPYASTSDAPPPAPPDRESAAAAVLARYRSQLDAKAQREGVANVDTLRAAYADKIAALRKKDAVASPAAEALARAEEEEASQGQKTAAATDGKTAAASGARPLSAFLDVDKARGLPAEELTAVWRLRFAADPRSLCAVVPATTYAAMATAARARPQFVLPVPHPEQGAEVHFLQWTFGTGDPTTTKTGGGDSTVLFTQLAEYKVRGEFAQPHTTVTHYTDLAADCGVVLMQGQVAEGRGATAADARWLVMCLQRFYGAWASAGAAAADPGALRRRQLVQWFAAGDPQFSIEALMEEVEKLG